MPSAVIICSTGSLCSAWCYPRLSALAELCPLSEPEPVIGVLLPESPWPSVTQSWSNLRSRQSDSELSRLRALWLLSGRWQTPIPPLTLLTLVTSPQCGTQPPWHTRWGLCRQMECLALTGDWIPSFNKNSNVSRSWQARAGYIQRDWLLSDIDKTIKNYWYSLAPFSITGPPTVPPERGLLSHCGRGTLQWGAQEVNSTEAAAR